MNLGSQSRVGWLAVVLAFLAIGLLAMQRFSPPSPIGVRQYVADADDKDDKGISVQPLLRAESKKKEKPRIVGEVRPRPRLTLAVDSSQQNEVVEQKRPQQTDQDKQISELLRKIEVLEVRERAREAKEAAERQKRIEDEIRRLKLENEELKKREEVHRKAEKARWMAQTLIRLRVTYYTTRDDKDD